MSSPRARNASSLGRSKTICDCTKVAPAATFRCSSRSSRSRASANGLTTAPTASECGTLHAGGLAISSDAVMAATWPTPATASPCTHSTPPAPSAAAPTTCDCNASRFRSRQETCTIVPTPCSRARATAANGGIRGRPAWLSVNPTTSTVSARTAMRSLTRWPSASAGSEISADVRAVTDTGESSQPDAPEKRRGGRKEGRKEGRPCFLDPGGALKSGRSPRPRFGRLRGTGAAPLLGRQLGRQLFSARFAVELILGRVDCLGLLDDLARELLVVEVLVARGVGVDLGAIDRDDADLDQPAPGAECEHLAEQRGDRVLVTSTKRAIVA